MAAIAKFVSFDGGVAFSEKVLKIQKRDEEHGRLIPLDRITGIEVDEPLLGDDGCIRIQIDGKGPTARNTIYFDEEQYDDALSFQAAFDSFMGRSSPALPPLEMFQPTAIVRSPQRGQTRYAEQERPSRPVRQTKRKRQFKWWYAVIAVVFVAVIATPGKKDTETKPQPEGSVFATAGPMIESTVYTAAEATTESGQIGGGAYTLPCGMDLNFSSSVRNDVTGRWRISTTSDSVVPADHALEYYNMLFSSDDEVHAIWNATLNTTTRITVSNGMLFVDTLEYVDGEEHDADLLFSGTVLDSKIINIETGQEVSFESETETTSFVGYTSPPAATALPTQAPTPTETMVWIPTNGGTKYHRTSSCSNMDNPEQVTLSEAGNVKDYAQN